MAKLSWEFSLRWFAAMKVALRIDGAEPSSVTV
jgi:hypothetical protein